jgi:hypothetical protein
MNVPTMADMMAQGKQPEVLFWVGAAGSYDDRAKKITAFVCRGLKRPKLNQEIPSVTFGNKNIKANNKPTEKPTIPQSKVA